MLRIMAFIEKSSLRRFPQARGDVQHLLVEQSQLSQSVLMGEVLQLLHHLCGPLLGSLHYIHVSLAVVSTELAAGLL